MPRSVQDKPNARDQNGVLSSRSNELIVLLAWVWAQVAELLGVEFV